ncbi:uncharacterized protein N0V96_003768 [Colletotrichum fioriniae]|uniref:uncharacterized protein n=1 Tax=Colletotrichum fioriniae TaxID=710243 RepID=UPI0032DB972A|nr:hypothetical protein N0V96_003768 [Colletotrichum fioriniae]
MKVKSSILLSLLGLASQAQADPTWPSDIDELEEIMYQSFNFGSRHFADNVFPCAKEATGTGRQTAAEWLRTAFHDMAPANAGTGVGGLDASIQYELSSTGENTGPAFSSTLTFMGHYLTRKSSMSDLIALGVYTSVLSCGGPSVAIRSGRIDATVKGAAGVPQPNEVIQVFNSKFNRMGFTPQEMIQVTACGHTIGGVHTAENPTIVPDGTNTNGSAPMDSSNGVFDNRVVTEYLDGTTRNPLVIKMGTARASNSDFVVFSSDKNATVKAMTDLAVFKSTCKTVFEKMINTVPSGVTLGDAIAPYTVKPSQLQLSLTSSTIMTLTGYIRVRTTAITGISSLTINYKNRSGGSTCGTGSCVFTITISGISKGLEDSFSWYPIRQEIPVSTGISSFTVTINKSDGSSTLFNNNGNWYPIQDGIFLQTSQSCLTQNSGDVTLVAAVRNDRTSLPVKAEISYKTARTSSVVPLLGKMTVDMVKGDCVGSYTFYSVTTNIPGGVSFESTFDFISGEGASAMIDPFKKADPIGGTCSSWTGGSPTCGSVTVSSSTSSAAATATISHRQTMGGYKLVSCWTEASGGRALSGAAFAYDGMTLDSCMANCTGFDYWGTEYGRECYCGNSLAASSSSAPLADCSMQCSGDSTQYCGAGNRIELYSTTATRTSSSTAAPTATLAHINTVGKYSLVGCQTEADGGRALSAAQTAADDMTLDKCASFCSDYTFFGTEYGRECYCGNSLAATSKTAPLSECNMNRQCLVYFGFDGGYYDLEQFFIHELYQCLSGERIIVFYSDICILYFQHLFDLVAGVYFNILNQCHVLLKHLIEHCLILQQRRHFIDSLAFGLKHRLNLNNHISDASSQAYHLALHSDYKYFGTEYSSECYCGNTLASTSAAAPLADCSMTCSGNKYEYCGGGNRLTLYQSDKQVTGPSQPATAGAYAFLGCRTEPAQGGRALDGKATASSDKMTNEACAAFCDGYSYFGTEYGGECYCGNSLPTTSLDAPLSDCSMLCTGSSTEYCGNGNRLSVYKK